MKMTLRKYSVTAFIILLLAGCNNPFAPPVSKDAETTGNRANTGYVSISIGETDSGRTILPPDFNDNGYFNDFDLVFTPADTSLTPLEFLGQTRENLLENIPIPAGAYKLVVTVCYGGNPVARSAPVDITVTAGETLTQTVTVRPISEGAGSFSWTITFPATPAVMTAVMHITKFDSASTEEPVTVNLLDPAIYTSAERKSDSALEEMDAGYYRVVITMTTDSGRKAEWREILHVYQNRGSVFTKTFGENAFHDSEAWISDYTAVGLEEYYPTLRDAIQAANTVATSETAPVEIELLRDVNALAGYTVSGHIRLLGNDKKITAAAGGFALFTVDGADATLALGDGDDASGTLTLDGGEQDAQTNRRGVYVTAGKLIMEENATIQDFNNTENGGGVYIASGSFEMSSGTISSNTASGGGGVYVASGSFEMSGGTISSNTSTSVSTTGGGVNVDNGTFIMSGGTISGNTSYSKGGGVSIIGGDVTMSGGEISGNTAPNGSGGGVYIQGGDVTMSGGEISSNTAPYGSGGGVYIQVGTFIMSGGTIHGSTVTDPNTALTGAAIFVQTGASAQYDGDYEDDYGDAPIETSETTLPPTAPPSDPDSEAWIVGGSNYASLQLALDAVPTNGTATTINILKEIATIPAEGYTIGAGKKVTIRAANALTLHKDTAGSLFTVDSGAELTLGNITLQGYASNTTALVSVSGTLVMNAGAVISGNTDITAVSGASGGGVDVLGGSFTMNADSSITGNTAYTGGGVHISDGSFTMNAGSLINGNIASHGAGGGVCIFGGAVIMSGGEISGNKANSSEKGGGGVYIQGGTFTMSGGTIYGSGEGTKSNTATTVGTAAAIYIQSPGTAAYSDYGTGSVIETSNDTLPPPPEARIGSQKYTTLAQAISQAPDHSIIFLLKDITLNGAGYTINNNNGFTLTSEDAVMRTITQNGQGSIFTVQGTSGSGSSLTLDSTITLQGSANNTVSLIKIGNLGNVNIGNMPPYGPTLKGNTNTTGNGGAVSIDSGGTLNMIGGLISGNTTSNSSSGGAVALSGGEFTMSGGIIEGNGYTVDTAPDPDTIAVNTRWGGGVYVGGGTFKMTGGTIRGNKSSTNGGGVHVIDGGIFSKTAGTITGNDAGTTDSNIAQGENVNGKGHAVFHDSDAGDKYRDKTVAATEALSTGDSVWIDPGQTSSEPTDAGFYRLASGSYTTVDNVTSTSLTAVIGHVNDNAGVDGFLLVVGENYPNVTTTPAAFTGGKLTVKGVNPTSTITLTSTGGINNGGLFTVNGTAELTLKDITLEGNTGNTYALIRIGTSDGGTVTMESGAVITGNTNGDGSNGAGAVDVGTGATFTMKSGARISGNHSEGSDLAAAGGVFLKTATSVFNMEGGEISGNSADWAGGGVYMNGGNFTMSGDALVQSNTAGSEDDNGTGGGVYVGGGTFTMRDNATLDGNILRPATGSGGGVYVYAANFTMEGGYIKKHTAGSGAGVYLATGGSIDKTGGVIYGNNADTDSNIAGAATKGHAVYHQTTFKYRDKTVTGALSTDDSDWTDSIPITSRIDLAKIGVDSAYPLDGDYILMANINVGSWTTPIGPSGTGFTGTFDGNNSTYSITGISISSTSTLDCGLFGIIGVGGTVENLTMRDVSVNVSSLRVGAIVGTNGGAIRNCHIVVEANKKIEATGANNVGGIAANNANSSNSIIENCSVQGDVSNTGNLVGGIVSSNSGTVRNCFFQGTVVSTAGGRVGGIAGNNALLIENCLSVGASVKALAKAGGIVGDNTTSGTTGITRNCVALIEDVYAPSAVGRIAGANTTTLLSSNYARDDMLSDSNAYTWTGTTENGISGAPVTASDYNNENWWTTPANWHTADGAKAWTFDSSSPWKWDADAPVPGATPTNGLPQLRDMPQ